MASTYPSLSPSCQQIISERLTSLADTHILIRSSLNDPRLWPVISEHKCNGVALTPAGLYTDMVVTVATHIWKRLSPTTDAADDHADTERPGINVFGLDVHKPFIAKIPPPADGQWVEMETTVLVDDHAAPSNTDTDTSSFTASPFARATLECTFHSVNPAGTRLVTHARCLARWERESGWLEEWNAGSSTATIATAMENLETRARVERAPRGVRLVYRDRAYELFRSFVDYGAPYRNMRKVVFDPRSLEATAELEFDGVREGCGIGEEGMGPYLMDGSCHVSGFVCNAVLEDGEKNAFVSHGMAGMKLSSRFRWWPGKELRNYVRMEWDAGDSSVMVGDVWILQDGEIVGVWEKVKFKKLPRRVLNIFLPPPKK